MKPTLSIGIAAFNEQQNITKLLSLLTKQIITCADLTEVVVVSDASDDGTDEMVGQFKNVTLIRLPKRSGLNVVQEAIRNRASADIVVLLDADIIPADEYTIETLIRPLTVDPYIGLTSARLIPATPQTFVEKILARNHIFKTQLFSQIGTGNNIYTCFGPVRAFSKKLYRAVQFPNNCPTDAMSYLLCQEQGLRFQFVSNAAVIFRCPNTVKDHIKQSSRFMSGKKSIIHIFKKSAKDAYQIPLLLLLRRTVLECMVHPILFSGFVAIRSYVQQYGLKVFSSQWEVSPSSKKI